MDMDTYQKQAQQTFIPSENILERLILGLNGEAGEVAEAMKKAIRDDQVDRDERLHQELGDVLWYTALIAEEINADLSKIAANNLDKLKDREDTGTIRGDGDDR
jgi:NTP pyrophosphatase (non-canonical NTP hydrolase)